MAAEKHGPANRVSLTDGFDHSRPFGANCETVGNIFYVATAEGRPIWRQEGGSNPEFTENKIWGVLIKTSNQTKRPLLDELS